MLSKQSRLSKQEISFKKKSGREDLFNTLCTGKLIPENFKESSDPIADFISSLIEISKECIPQTSTNPTKSNPWYNDDCKEAIKQHNKLYLNSKDLQIPTISMTSKYLELKSLERLKFRIASHGDLMFRKTNKKNLINKVRDMIRKISGKTKSSIYTHLN